MYVNIKLKKNFSTAWNSMIEKYGDEFAALNGFSDETMDYTDFIQNFIDQDTVADASIDANANVGHKDIVTLMKEMSKPHQKLLAFNKIFYEINKAYGYPLAKEWLEMEWCKALYLHDANTSTYVPYCYKGEETLTVQYRGQTQLVSMATLYDLVKESEEFDPSIRQVAKFPKDLKVLDIVDGNIVYTPVYRVVKHKNNKTMRFIKYSNGLSQIVTEDHPVITDRGDVPAKDVLNSDKVFTVKPTQFDGTIYQITVQDMNYVRADKQDNTFKLDNDLGWLVGIILADASTSQKNIVISQTENNEEWNKILQACDDHRIPYTILEDPKYGRSIGIRSCAFTRWLTTQDSVMQGQLTRCLPGEFIHYNHDFLDGVVAGIIDGDGCVWGNTGDARRGCTISSISETLLHQISAYLQFKGSFCSSVKPSITPPGSFTDGNTGVEYNIVAKHPLHGIYFNIGMNEDYLTSIGSLKIASTYTPRKRKKGIFANKRYSFHYDYVTVLSNEEYVESCDVVYDITTSSGHFICNNVLSHNCYAYTLKRLAEEGQFFQENYNNQPPRHLDTFIDFVKEFVSYTSNRTSGACGLPDLIPYMYFFWREDIKSHHMGLTEEYAEKYAKQNIQRFIYAVNQTYVRDNCQSAFTNTSVFDRPYLTALFGGATFPDGSLMVDDIEGIMKFQQWYMEKMSEIREENMFTFPVNTISLLKQKGKFVDEQFAKWSMRHNMKWLDSNIFCSDEVTSLSNCCRLKSNIKDLGFFNSVGGTSLRVGSVKVSTINLARIALETRDELLYLDRLKRAVYVDLVALDTVRHIIKRNIEKNMLPNYCDGMIDLATQYNTVGVLGIYEVMKTFGYTYTDDFGNVFYNDDAMRFGKSIFKTIQNVIDEFKQDKDYMINIEQVPGEQAAVKFMKADVMLYPGQAVTDLPLYGNQFIPLGIKTTLQERIRISSAFDEFCNGGSITHINVESPFKNFDQMWDTLNYITDKGVTYFAFTTKIQSCEQNHAFFGKQCPKCGKPVARTFQRIVGFYTPTTSWSKERKAEGKMRKWPKPEEICLPDSLVDPMFG